MSGHEWEILAGAILLVIGQFIASVFAQRKETGKRIGSIEKRLDFSDGYKLGYREGWRDAMREKVKRKDHAL